MIDIDLIVQTLRQHGHRVDSVISVPENAGEYEFVIDGNLKEVEYVERLSEIKIPTLIIVGDRDVTSDLTAKDPLKLAPFGTAGGPSLIVGDIFSTGVLLLLPILCRNPSVCPTSWEETKRIRSPINASSNFILRARGSTAAVCTMYQS